MRTCAQTNGVMVTIGTLLAIVLVGSASAAGGPRFKLRPDMTLAQAIRQLDRKIDRAPGFSNADCWQGSAGATAHA